MLGFFPKLFAVGTGIYLQFELIVLILFKIKVLKCKSHEIIWTLSSVDSVVCPLPGKDYQLIDLSLLWKAHNNLTQQNKQYVNIVYLHVNTSYNI